MKAKVYIGAKKYAVYIGRKIVEKTLEFLSLPAQFISSKVQVLKNLSLWGQSVQDGTPTPTTPIPVVSVGDKTKNLFDAPDGTYTKGGVTIVKNGNTLDITKTGTGYGTLDFDGYNIKAGTTVTVNCNISESKDMYSGFRLRNTKTGEFVSFNKVPYTIKIDFDVDRLQYFCNNVEGTSVIANLQIEEGSTATPYEPYGYKVPVTVGGATTNIYLNEPLRKIDEYADTMSVDGTEVTVVRNVGAVDFAKITFENYNTQYRRYRMLNFPNIQKQTIRGGYGLSDTVSIWNVGGDAKDVPDNYFYWGADYEGYLVESSIKDKVILKDVLSGYNLYYPLATPTTETYTIDTPILAPQGTLTFDVDTVIKPTKTTITGDIDYVR